MAQSYFIANQTVINCLDKYYGITLSSLTSIPLGADVDACVYKAQGSDGVLYFVKVKRGYHNNIGVKIQLLLHNAGIKNIIAPLQTNNKEVTCYFEGFTFIVYPFIEGENGFSRPLSDDQWIRFGKFLRQIHDVRLPDFIKDELVQSYSSKWRDRVRSIYTHIDSESKLSDDIAFNMTKFMKEKRSLINSLVDHAEQLAEKIKEPSPYLVLCHSDIHAGNLLITNDNFYIVDWDTPVIAPKERDLMFIGGGVGNVWNNQHEVDLFYRGYGDVEINKDLLAHYRYERILEDIVVYCEQLLLIANNEHRDKMYTEFMNMFKVNGVVDIALKTVIVKEARS